MAAHLRVHYTRRGTPLMKLLIGGAKGTQKWNHRNFHEIFLDRRCKPFPPRARVTGYSVYC
jgi:hypothetical protein